jgi:hypothetical protein
MTGQSSQLLMQQASVPDPSPYRPALDGGRPDTTQVQDFVLSAFSQILRLSMSELSTVDNLNDNNILFRLYTFIKPYLGRNSSSARAREVKKNQKTKTNETTKN